MRNAIAGLVAGCSALALSVPAAAQEKTEDEATEFCQDNAGLLTACVAGVVASGWAANEMAQAASESVLEERADINRQIKENYANKEIRKTARTGQNVQGNYGLLKDGDAAPGQTSAKRMDNLAEMRELERRGELARNARAQPSAGTAADFVNARDAAEGPRNIRQLQSPDARRNALGRGSQLDDLVRRGEMAQNARVKPNAGTAADFVNARDAAEGPRNIRQLQSPDARRNALGKGSQLDDLVRRGEMAQSNRQGLRSAAKASQGSQQLGRQVLADGNDLGRVLKQGDAARAARNLAPGNETQLIRQIADKGGDITDLNRAGRSAQAGRQAGGLKAMGKADDAARVLSKTDDLAKIASTGAKVGRAGRAGRAVLAASGAGAVAVAAEIAATESVKALTGAEIQDPISTGFQYGAAIFDKDVTIADVAAQRMGHHRENFRRVGDTLTTEGKLVDNLTSYADSKNPALGNMVRGFDQSDRAMRSAIENKTGVKLERRIDVAARYGGALGDEGLGGVARVASERTKHHFDNATALAKTTQETSRKIGAANRAAIGNATGADLRSVKETSDRYNEAMSGDNKAQAVATVAADRARHHTENAKKVGSKVACGIGNIFRKKEKDKDC